MKSKGLINLSRTSQQNQQFNSFRHSSFSLPESNVQPDLSNNQQYQIKIHGTNSQSLDGYQTNRLGQNKQGKGLFYHSDDKSSESSFQIRGENNHFRINTHNQSLSPSNVKQNQKFQLNQSKALFQLKNNQTYKNRINLANQQSKVNIVVPETHKSIHLRNNLIGQSFERASLNLQNDFRIQSVSLQYHQKKDNINQSKQLDNKSSRYRLQNQNDHQRIPFKNQKSSLNNSIIKMQKDIFSQNSASIHGKQNQKQYNFLQIEYKDYYAKSDIYSKTNKFEQKNFDQKRTSSQQFKQSSKQYMSQSITKVIHTNSNKQQMRSKVNGTNYMNIIKNTILTILCLAVLFIGGFYWKYWK